MAANNSMSDLDSHFDRISVTTENLDESVGNETNVSESTDTFHKTWGFRLPELYKLAVKFLKDKEGKAMQLTYKDRLRLVSLSQQVSHGPYQLERSPPVGVLDVIGKDRRQAWQSLGDMPKELAMENFVTLLDRICPLFAPFIAAHKVDLQEKERIKRQEEEKQRQEEEEHERLRLEEEATKKEEQDRLRIESQRQQIQDALNQQTYHQFKAYAEQQFPGNPDQQGLLIRQLQEQHYQQYMQQIYQQQFVQQQQQELNRQTVSGDGGNNNNNMEAMTTAVMKRSDGGDENENSDDSDAGTENGFSSDLPPIVPASMWTRKDIKEFKEVIRKDGGDAIIKVGHGETVTVRVPTHEDGTCVFWEFATDSYDLGFGVHFEFTKTPGSQVSVHISESEDEEEEEETEHIDKDDIEKGGGGGSGGGITNANTLVGSGLGGDATTNRSSASPPVAVIIPVYRRDCHDEVYAGSHVYPGKGVYLLKFDNSYSLWRSKTLYYRVYYTR